MPFGSTAIGSVLKGAKQSKQQVVDELSSSFAYFISGKDYDNFGKAMKDFRNSNDARVPIAKVDFTTIKKQLSRVYSVIEDYRTNDEYAGKVKAEQQIALIGKDSSVVAKMTRLDKGTYLLPLKYMPSMNSYDASIGAMFRLFKDVDKLETVVASNGAKLSFKRTKDGYKLVGGKGIDLSDYSGTKYNLPSYKDPSGKVFIPGRYDLSKALGLAKDDFTFGNAIGFASSKNFFDKTFSTQASMRRQAKQAYQSYAKKIIGTASLGSIDSVLNTPISSIKQKIKIDAGLHAKTNPYGKLEYSALGQKLMDAIEYTGADKLTIKDLFKGNKSFLNSINQYMKDKALVESRRKVSNRIADIYLRHGKPNGLTTEMFDYLYKHIKPTIKEGLPTISTFKALDNADDFLADLTSANKLDTFFSAPKKLNPIGFMKFITNRGSRDIVEFLDAEGTLPTEYIEQTLRNGLLGNKGAFKAYNKDRLSKVVPFIKPIDKENLAQKGPFFSDKIISELNDLSINTPRRVNKFAKNRGFTDFMRIIDPNEGDGIGIVHEGWATKGLLGDEYLFSQLDNGDDLSEQEFRAIVDNLPSSKKSGRALVKDANSLGLKPDLQFSDTITIGKDTAVDALNGPIKDTLNRASKGRVNPELLYKFFETTQFADGVVPSIVQQLWKNNERLSLDELATVERLATATGFVRRGSGLVSSKELTRMFMQHLLPLQHEINSSREQRTVSIMPNDRQIRPELIKAALSGKALNINELNNPELLTGLDQDHKVDSGVFYKTGLDKSNIIKKSKSNKDKVSKGRLTYAPAADQIDHYIRLSGFTKSLFKGKFSGLTNYWDSRIASLQNSKDGIALPPNGSIYGNAISELEKKLLTRVKKYITTSNALPGEFISSPLGGFDNLANFNYDKLKLLSADKRIALQKEFEGSLVSLEKALLSDQSVYPVISEITMIKAQKRALSAKKKPKTDLGLFDYLSAYAEENYKPGVSSLDNKADIEASYNTNHIMPNIDDFDSTIYRLKAGLSSLESDITKGYDIPLAAIKAIGPIKEKLSKYNLNNFTPNKALMLKGLESLIKTDGKGGYTGKLFRKIDPLDIEGIVSSIKNTDKLISLGKSAYKDAYKQQQKLNVGGDKLTERIFYSNDLDNSKPINESVNSLLALKKLVLKGSSLEGKTYNSLSFSLTKPLQQVIRKKASSDDYLNLKLETADKMSKQPLDKISKLTNATETDLAIAKVFTSALEDKNPKAIDWLKTTFGKNYLSNKEFLDTVPRYLKEIGYFSPTIMASNHDFGFVKRPTAVSIKSSSEVENKKPRGSFSDEYDSLKESFNNLDLSSDLASIANDLSHVSQNSLTPKFYDDKIQGLARVKSMVNTPTFKKANDSLKRALFSRLISKLPKFARGGYLPGRSVKDEIPALLMKGETVLTQSTSEALGIKNHDDYKRFEAAAEAGQVRGFVDGDNLEDLLKQTAADSNKFKKSTIGTEGSKKLVDIASLRIEELKALGLAGANYSQVIADIVAFDKEGKSTVRNNLDKKITESLKNKDFVMSLSKDEAKNLVKSSATLKNFADLPKVEKLIDSIFNRLEGSMDSFSTDTLNAFSNLSKGESIVLRSLLEKNPFSESAFKDLVAQGKSFNSARAWYQENGIEQPGSNFSIKESSMFTTSANIQETTKLLKDIYKHQELASKLGLDTAKIMEGITGSGKGGSILEKDFINYYMDNKDKAKTNILDPFRNNEKVVQTEVSGLTDEGIHRAIRMASGLAAMEEALDPDNVTGRVKKDNINAAAGAAQGFRNSAITRWANFKDQMMQNAAYMAGYGVLSIPVGAAATAIGGAVEFEDSLKNLQAITGSSTEQLNSMTKAIKHVAVNTKFSATEIAGAATTLGQAGFTAAEINSSLGGIVKLATATGSSLEDSTQTLTSALTVWDRPLSDSDSMANEMTAAINKSKLDMGSITSSIQYAGNIAAQGGIPLTDLLTMTSLMKDAGIKQPSTIATGSRLVYADFMAPSKKFAKSLKEASISLDEFQGTFDKGGVVETVKFLKSKGYGFSEASRGMEVRERVAYMAMLNQIDKADAFRASITGTQAADTANEVQMSSGINSFKNMINSWQMEMYDVSESMLKSVSWAMRGLTADEKKPTNSLFKPNTELGTSDSEDGFSGGSLAAATGLGLLGAVALRKLGSKEAIGSFLGLGQKGTNALINTYGGMSIAVKGLSKAAGPLALAGSAGIDAKSTYDEYQDGGAAYISGIHSLAKSFMPFMAGAMLGAKGGTAFGPWGALGGALVGAGVAGFAQDGLGITGAIDKHEEKTLNDQYGIKGTKLISALNARSEEQSSFIKDLSKTLKFIEDDKASKLQASDKLDTEESRANRNSKELAAYNRALELDKLHVDKLLLLDKPMSFTEGVYDSYNQTGGKVSSNEKLVENTKAIINQAAEKAVELQSKSLPDMASVVLSKDVIDKIHTIQGLDAFISSEGLKEVETLVKNTPLAYLNNKDKIDAFIKGSVVKTYEAKGFGEERGLEVADRMIKKMDMLFKSSSFSGESKQTLNALIKRTNEDIAIPDESKSKIIRSAKQELGNIYLEESGFNKLKDKAQEYSIAVGEVNQKTFDFIDKVADKTNDFNFNAIRQVGAEGYKEVSQIAKVLANSVSKFNAGSTTGLLSKYLDSKQIKNVLAGDRDKFKESAGDLGKLTSEANGVFKSKLSVFDTAANAAEGLSSALIAASQAAESFANSKNLTGNKETAIKNNDLADYQFSKALEQAFVSKGVNVGSIESLLATDVSSMNINDRGSLAKFFDSNFNKKLDFQKQTANEDIDYNAGLQVKHAYRDKSFNEQVNSLQQSFKAQDIERNRAHSVEEAGINYQRQVESIGRQRQYAISGANRNLAQNLYQIGVNFQRSLQKLNTDNARTMEKLATDVARAQEKLDTDKTRSLTQARINYDRGLQDLGTGKTRNIEDATTNLNRSLEDLSTSIRRARHNLDIDVRRSISDANLSFTRQVNSVQQAMADTAYMFQRSLDKPVNIQLDPESLVKVADNLDNLSLAMDAHKASLEANTSAVKEYLGINQSKEDLVKGAYLQAYKASGGDVNSDTFKTSYEEYMKANGSQLVDTVVGYGLDTAMAGNFDTTRALYDPTYVSNAVANPTDPTTTEDAVANSGMSSDQIVTALLGNGQGQFTIQTTQGVVLEAKGEMESALFDLETQMINFGFNIRDAATNLTYALTDIQTSYARSIEDLMLTEQQQLEDINLSFSRAISDIELAYARGLEDLNLGLQRSFQDIALQYQYALDDLRLSQSQSITDIQLSFSQALDDLRLNTEWQRQDALASFSFALQDINASYNQSLNEAAINYQNQINDINRNAAWQLSETFINNEQNKQIMELQFQQLLSSINMATEESKANLERQLGAQLASLVLDLQAMKSNIENQFKASMAGAVFDLSIAMSKLQEGINRASTEVEIDLSELRNKVEVAFRSIANDEKIKSVIATLGTSMEEVTRIIGDGGEELNNALKSWEQKLRETATGSEQLLTSVETATSTAEQVDSLNKEIAELYQSIRDSQSSIASDAGRSLSSVSSTNQSTIQMGNSLMTTSMQISSSLMAAVSSVAQSMAEAQRQIAAMANSAMSSASFQQASIGAVIPGYGGGDILPFMLEPGEAVVRKEVVRSLGGDFFRQLNSSPNSLSAGLVRGILGLDSSPTQSATNVSSGYNINIQVAPDASLSTIERNIDKIANGVRQVFEEYL